MLTSSPLAALLERPGYRVVDGHTLSVRGHLYFQDSAVDSRVGLWSSVSNNRGVVPFVSGETACVLSSQPLWGG